MLQKQVILDKVEVFPDGELHVHRTTVISEDGKELMRQQEIDKIPRGGNLPKDGGIVSIIASALWSASAVQDGLRDQNFKKGKLYYTSGPSAPQRQALAGTVSGSPSVQIKDERATKIKHRGKEQGGGVSYGRGPTGKSEPIPQRAIKHRGKEQR